MRVSVKIIGDEMRIPDNWPKITAVVFIIPALISFYYAVSALSYLKYQSTNQWINGMLLFTVCLGAISMFVWHRSPFSLFLTWVALLPCLARFFLPVLLNPKDCIWCLDDSQRSTDWEHALLIFISVAFLWITYLLLTSIKRLK